MQMSCRYLILLFPTLVQVNSSLEYNQNIVSVLLLLLLLKNKYTYQHKGYRNRILFLMCIVTVSSKMIKAKLNLNNSRGEWWFYLLGNLKGEFTVKMSQTWGKVENIPSYSWTTQGKLIHLAFLCHGRLKWHCPCKVMGNRGMLLCEITEISSKCFHIIDNWPISLCSLNFSVHSELLILWIIWNPHPSRHKVIVQIVITHSFSPRKNFLLQILNHYN